MSAPTTVPAVVLALGCLPVGAFLLRARPANRVGLLLTLVGVGALLAVVAAALGGTRMGAWVEQWAWWPPWALLVATLPFYPEGRLRGRTRQWLVTLALGAGAVATVGLAVGTFLTPGLLVAAALAHGATRGALLVAASAIAVVVGVGAAAVVELVLRARRAARLERTQIRALLPAGVLIVLGIVVEALGLPYATVPGLLAVPVGMGIAILAYHLDDLDRRARHSVVRSREEERLRIRRDLHDGLGPAIAGARMQAAAASRPEADPTELLASVQETLSECSQEMRRIVDGLRPGALDRGLLAAIQQRADAIGPEPTVAVTAVGRVADLDAALEVAVFRIVTEALSNAARHSGASRVWVTLDGTGPDLRVEVGDDGRGGARYREGGVGMESMRQRAEEVGGRLTVESDETGTRVRVQLPR